MNLERIKEALELQVVYEPSKGIEITGAYSGDLLSDIMSHANDGELLITIQAHKNTLAVATLKDMPAIIICNNRPIPDDLLESAKDEEVAILLSKETPFVVAGKIYKVLNS